MVHSVRKTTEIPQAFFAKLTCTTQCLGHLQRDSVASSLSVAVLQDFAWPVS